MDVFKNINADASYVHLISLGYKVENCSVNSINWIEKHYIVIKSIASIMTQPRNYY